MITYTCDCCKNEMPPEDISRSTLLYGVPSPETKVTIVNGVELKVSMLVEIVAKSQTSMICGPCARKAITSIGVVL